MERQINDWYRYNYITIITIILYSIKNIKKLFRLGKDNIKWIKKKQEKNYING
jgi:hypothetical protein